MSYQIVLVVVPRTERNNNTTKPKPKLQIKLSKKKVQNPKISIEDVDVFLGKMEMSDLLKFFYLAKYNSEEFEFNIVIDEGDLLAGEEKKTELVLTKIMRLYNCFHTLQVTATPLASILSSPKINYFYKLEVDQEETMLD